jgi:hypothetical protein
MKELRTVCSIKSTEKITEYIEWWPPFGRKFHHDNKICSVW